MTFLQRPSTSISGNSQSKVNEAASFKQLKNLLVQFFENDTFYHMDNHLQFWFLRNHEVLKRLTETQLIELNAIAEFKRAERDDFIYSFDQEIDKIYFLCRGRIKIAFSIDQNLEVVAEILKDG